MAVYQDESRNTTMGKNKSQLSSIETVSPKRSNRKTRTIGILVLIGVIDTGAAYSLLRQIYSIGLSIYGLSESKIW